MIKVQRPYYGVDVSGPQFRVAVSIARLLRQTVPSHIHCYKSEAIGQVRVDLSTPRKPTLREAVDEQERATLRVSRLYDV
jgi:hypothetical protein